MDGHIRGVVTQWQPPQRLSYTWNVFNPGDPADAVSAYPESYLTLALERRGGDVLLVLDEPTAGMNPRETDALTEFIDLLRREIGVSVLLIEHHMEVVMGISDRIMVLDYGEKIAEGKPDEVRANPAVITAYLGEG